MKLARATKPKPKVAFDSEIAAHRNIVLKLTLIQFAVGLPQTAPLEMALKIEAADLLPHCPSSLRKFSEWSSDCVPQRLRGLVPDFRASGPKTLARDTELSGRVEAAVDSVSLLRSRFKTRKTPLETLAGAKRAQDEAVLLKDIAMRELTAVREQSKKEVSAITTKLSGLENEVRELKDANSSLRGQLAGVQSKLAQILGTNVRNFGDTRQSSP